MLGTDPVPRSDNAPLQERERRLDGVGVDRPIDVDAAAVVDRRVPRAVVTSSGLLQL